MYWLLDIVFFIFIGNYGFTKTATLLENGDYARIVCLVAMLIMNTGMPVPILSLPVAEFVIMGKIETSVTHEQFPPGQNREMAE